ncbi:hypothetical protein MNB_SM-4-325 [hydrothermal vent metagenome]|uniref:Uncharacterized protein n=1 Tax=hydrothermal vent metagenome TaxID=652676 RepID=A0A1W1BKV7_9ZZZZ
MSILLMLSAYAVKGKPAGVVTLDGMKIVETNNIFKDYAK